MKVVTFGEVMGRMAPPGLLRFRQGLPGMLEMTFGGAEANVAVALALLGAEARFVTALPKHTIADACVDRLRGLGVDTQHVLRTDIGRLGLYFLEPGANQRPSRVTYDRDGASIAITPGSAYDWPAIFAGATWFHTTGITPALSRTAAEAAVQAVQVAKGLGLTVSCDLNFRKNLWRWEPGAAPAQLAQTTMRRLLPYVDLLIANEEDCADVLGLHVAGADFAAGKLEVDHYPGIARIVIQQFPNLARVAITLRESLSASHNNWGAMLYCRDGERFFFAPGDAGRYEPYEIRNIVDRVGAGDSFGAALIFALNTPELAEPSAAVAFAAAASCLAHSIVGDFNFASRPEIEALVQGARSGRVVR
jgi:2-dehydro-3-deoxygluconokinase